MSSRRSTYTLAFLQTNVSDFIETSNWPSSPSYLNLLGYSFCDAIQQRVYYQKFKNIDIWNKSWTVSGTWSAKI